MSPCGCRIDRRFGLPHDAGAGFQFAKTDWKIAFDCFFGPFLYSIPWNRNNRISAASGASADPLFFFALSCFPSSSRKSADESLDNRG